MLSLADFYLVARRFLELLVQLPSEEPPARREMGLTRREEHMVDAVLDGKEHLQLAAERSRLKLRETDTTLLTSPRRLACEDLKRVVMPVKAVQARVALMRVASDFAEGPCSLADFAACADQQRRAQ